MERQKKGKELKITRIFDAPVELVWRAWTDPASTMRWWGPKDFTTPLIRMDFRVGGTYLYDMRSPEGKDFWDTGTILNIDPMKKIVLTDSFSDENGNVVPASHYGMTGDFPMEALVTVTFRNQKGKTKFTLHYEGIPPGEILEQARAGWNESFDKLDRVLEEEKARLEKNVIVLEKGKPAMLTRIIEAQPARVFAACTDPALIPRWWGPANLTTVVEKMDARSGGSWRFIQRDTQGNEYAFHGVYHEVSPDRIVQTFEFEGTPGQVMLQVTTFEDLGGRTKLTDKSVIESQKAIEEMLKSGMLEGWRETIDRLADLAEKGMKAEPAPVAAKA